MVQYETAKAEPNLTLMMNTSVMDVVLGDSSRGSETSDDPSSEALLTRGYRYRAAHRLHRWNGQSLRVGRCLVWLPVDIVGGRLRVEWKVPGALPEVKPGSWIFETPVRGERKKWKTNYVKDSKTGGLLF